jgi:hypothetical protein
MRETLRFLKNPLSRLRSTRAKHFLSFLFGLIFFLCIVSESFAGSEKKAYLRAFGILPSENLLRYTRADLEQRFLKVVSRLALMQGGESFSTTTLDRLIDAWDYIRHSEIHEIPKITANFEKHIFSSDLENYLRVLLNDEGKQNLTPGQLAREWVLASDRVEVEYWFLYDLFVEGKSEILFPEERLSRLNQPHLFGDPFPDLTLWLKQGLRKHLTSEKKIVFFKIWPSKIRNLNPLYSEIHDYMVQTSELTHPGMFSKGEFLGLFPPNEEPEKALSHSIALITFADSFGVEVPREAIDPMISLKRFEHRFRSKGRPLAREPAVVKLLTWMQIQIFGDIMGASGQAVSSPLKLEFFAKYIELRNRLLDQSTLKEQLMGVFQAPSEEAAVLLPPIWYEWIEIELMIHHLLQTPREKVITFVDELSVRLRLSVQGDFPLDLPREDVLDVFTKLRVSWIELHPFLTEIQKCPTRMSSPLLNPNAHVHLN